MPRKEKKVQKQSTRQADSSPADTAETNTRKVRRAVGKTKAAAKKTIKRAPSEMRAPETAAPAEPSDEQIRLRAYFISERRRRLALPGDASSDWLEAKRQLLSDASLE